MTGGDLTDRTQAGSRGDATGSTGAQAAPGTRCRLAVVIPAYNAAATLTGCLAALRASTRQPDDLILYDDGSTDGTGDIARNAGIRVLRNPGPPVGPARGRNTAARATDADLIVFVDSDVVVHADAIERLEAALTSDSSLSAAYGSYDAHPPVRRLAARYANIRHHYIHQTSAVETVTFWTGLGAIRRQALVSIGGFDEHFESPIIEDIDLGARLHASGRRIRIVPGALGAHCKNWSLRQLWWTDITRRAIPWARLLAGGGGETGHLNASPRERHAAVAAHAVWMTALAAGFVHGPGPGLVCLGAAGTYLWLNRRLFRLFLDAGGLRLVVAGVGLHWLYHLYASAIYGTILLGTRVGLLPTHVPAIVEQRVAP